MKIQNVGGCHGNMPTVSLSSIRFSSKNYELLIYTLSFKNIWVLQNPVRGRVPLLALGLEGIVCFIP